LEETLLVELQACTELSCFVEFTYKIQDKIFTWVLYAPLSILLTLFEDPLRMILELGHHTLENGYGRVAKFGIDLYMRRHKEL